MSVLRVFDKSYNDVLDLWVILVFDMSNETIVLERFMLRKGPQTHHFVSDPNGGWDVRRGGSERASSHHDIKREAIDAGREMSRNQGAEFRIHKLDGRIASSDCHGPDPTPPKG